MKNYLNDKSGSYIKKIATPTVKYF